MWRFLDSAILEISFLYRSLCGQVAANVGRGTDSELLDQVGHHEIWGPNVPTYPWSSLVEGDEQLDRPNSQTIMALCHACVA